MNIEEFRSVNRRTSSFDYLSSFISFVLLLLLPTPSYSYTYLHDTRAPGIPIPFIQDAKDHDMNQVFLRINNNGEIGINISPLGGSGFWPIGTSNNYVFGSGLWFGGKADVDDDGDLDKVFVQGYNPIAGDSELNPGRLNQAPEDSLARIFDSNDPGDLSEWPDEFRDPDTGDPIVYSQQDFVTIYNDVSGSPIFGISNLGIEIRQRSMAFTHDLSQNIIYFEWDLTNVSEAMENGPYIFEDAWIGYDIDSDIGVAFREDLASFFQDMVTPSGDTLILDTGFTWDHDFWESNFDGTPGFLGLSLLQSPGNDADGIDNDGDGLVDESPFNGIDDDGDGDIDEEDEVDELGLVRFSKHITTSPPTGVFDPDTDEYGYDILSCDTEGSEITCWESDNPSEIRFMISSGPFDWLPGQTIRVRFAFVFAPLVGMINRLEFVGYPPRPDPNNPALTNLISTIIEARRFGRSGYTDYGNLPSLDNMLSVLPVNIPFFSYPVAVSIYDTVGIARASLFYSIDRNFFEEIDLTYSGNSLWDAEIPGPDFGSTVDFYYEAVDSIFNVNREPENAPQTTFGYNVVHLPDFTDVTTDAGISSGMGTGMAVADYDNDGDQDFYVANRNDLYRNEGDGTFRNIASSSGLSNVIGTSASWVDYDNDGHLDLFVTGSANDPTNFLLHANGDGTFRNVADSAGVATSGRKMSSTWGDYNNDGYVDLYLFNLAENIYSRNTFFRNNGDGTFTDIAGQTGLDFYWPGTSADIRIAVWVDADNDGWQDLFLTDPSAHVARLYRYNRDGTFTDIAGDSDLWRAYTFQVTFSDYDNDGDLDLISSSNTTNGGNGLYQNQGDGLFTDVTEMYDFDQGVLFDANNSGFLDVITPHSFTNGLFYLNRETEFIEIAQLLGSYPFPNLGSPLSFDYDNDGDLDVLTDRFSQILFRNEGFAPGYNHNWFHVICEGTASNRAAIGAKVRVTTGVLTQARVVGGARSNVQSSLLVEFGLGDATVVDRLVVEWPSGKVQELTGISVNQVITVIEDSTLVGADEGSGPESSIFPKVFALSQNYPNPFNPSTTIRYDIPGGSGIQSVKIYVYDIRGRLVRRLVDQEKNPGSYQVHWDGRDNQGETASSGVYLYRIEAGEFISTRKMILIR